MPNYSGSFTGKVNSEALVALRDRTAADLAQFLGMLVGHCLNQNDMMWNRTQLLIAIQGAVIGSAYYLHQAQQPHLARWLLVAGAILTILITILAIEDRQDRDANRELIGTVSNKILWVYGWRETHRFQITNRSRWCKHFGGDRILVVVFVLFIFLDVCLAIFGWPWAAGSVSVTPCLG